MKVTILGCGTSGGVPRIGGDDGHGIWGDCDPDNPKNRRRRVSILVQNQDTSLIVDTSPDFREQALDAGISELDAVLFTHDHADHIHGIDDLRGLAYSMRRKIDVYGDAATLDTVSSRFAYIFKPRSYYPAFCEAHIIDGPFDVGAIEVTPFAQIHGDAETLGFRFGPVAYSTDLNDLPPASIEILKGVRLWIVDALRPEPHPTHFSVDDALGFIARIKPGRAVLTHMDWHMDYETLRRELPDGVEPGYDGMTIEV